jgi:hypothetical protein
LGRAAQINEAGNLHKSFVENTQVKGRIRRTFALDALACHPHVQEICSSPNISIASISESDAAEHFRWKLM